DRLVFGRAYAESDTFAGSGIEALPDDMQICDCNGVCKGTIVAAIRQHGLVSARDVQKATKAGASCCGCNDRISELLALVHGASGAAAAAMPAAPPMCDCTTLGHAEVRREIRMRRLLSGADVREALGWEPADGCQKCRPALNYYCLSTFPGES